MDAAYKRHATEARRKNKSHTSLNHLSLAPLTSKLPLTDHDELPDFDPLPTRYNSSYLQGKSAPTTPRLLSRSPVQTRTNSPRRSSSTHAVTAGLPKSKSASHLHGLQGRNTGLGKFTPISRRRTGDQGPLSAKDIIDSDWLLHAGAFISTETRERKGQAWLISRASSTSLTGLRDAEEEAYERELAREKELASRRDSRRGSLGEDEDVLAGNSRYESISHSRVGSRMHLKTPLRTPLRTPMRTSLEHEGESGYFTPRSPGEDEAPGPDFVGLDEKLEAIEIDMSSQADEAAVRRLFKADKTGMGSWMGSLLGWSLFSVEENDEESDNADGDMTDGETDESHLSRSASTKSFPAISDIPGDSITPPEADEGGWKDAAWLLSVASKVIL
ncbi:hypothetical protein DL766_009890 [Monosporascus sp. MC13-8B]|uniref:Uncharacterized protein n=1 Tax=Monosporascus cannonballus TaxID=155416 RepID=A0ABY0GW61_9PEZI|nr:hypothetical protein DL762_008450 [Monosporascus cannonballus]RYO81211.1 hypothetical protein DL763_008657 [Monosporascus cannonballus]RYP13082.1 hypothetical protein DL766_009890 [Monosporascus sp. MC13-8B]